MDFKLEFIGFPYSVTLKENFPGDHVLKPHKSHRRLPCCQHGCPDGCPDGVVVTSMQGDVGSNPAQGKFSFKHLFSLNYISERLYSKDPEFWKESLALHCRRGLMFVCWNKISASDCSFKNCSYFSSDFSLNVLIKFVLIKKKECMYGLFSRDVLKFPNPKPKSYQSFSPHQP